MNCQNLQFSPEKSEERINSALRIFKAKVLFRIIAFGLYLLGAPRKAIADLLNMPEESLKTMLRIILRDGFPAIQDRRRSEVPVIPVPAIVPVRLSVSRDEEWIMVKFGPTGEPLRIPVAHKVQARAVLLSLLNSGQLSTHEAASFLEISESHCRELAAKLAREDIEKSLVDNRRGQTHDYHVGMAQKAELIRQFAARILAGHTATSEVLAKMVNQQTGTMLSPRTIRWHMVKLGLYGIKETLPTLLDTLKKTPVDTR
jgi:hypothetical protein